MASAERNLPTRTMTNDDDAIPDEDTSEVTKLFHERLQAWKHACGYLEDYVSATEKMQHAHAKEYEKVLKTVSSPLKEGHHFDQNLGGVAGTFDTIRSNTQGISNSHAETAKLLKGSVLPIFERLHTEIKNKTKELTKGAGKGSKAVDKARATSQKHIELLGQNTAAFGSTGGKISAHEDPYVLQRGVYHRLNKQVIEENNNRNDIIAVQNSFAQFEAHILTTIQNGLGQFNQVVGNQAEQTRTMYGNMTSTAQQVAPDFEWNGFVQRNNQVLIDPNAPPRSMSNISFPNQNHKATEPLIAGSLERKGKMLRKYESSYWVITPSRYMHEFTTDDDFAKDPVPETSLYLPDCMIGALDGLKFQVKGKDVSGSSFGNKLSMSHEYAFKAHTPQDATKWYEVLRSSTGTTTNDLPPTSPSASRQPSASIPSSENAGEPTKVFSEEDTRPQTTDAAALEAERKEAAYASAGPNDGVATHSKV
ncbi:PH domain-containing protein, partial [Aureobasidium melanogenum]|uniref:PH domain-containing protein n=1 Tax=Aureobasidium melanogenum (strain CBS 110374) TaxID=1043003 RepID=A0A074VHW4_AURM1